MASRNSATLSSNQISTPFQFKFGSQPPFNPPVVPPSLHLSPKHDEEEQIENTTFRFRGNKSSRSYHSTDSEAERALDR